MRHPKRLFDRRMFLKGLGIGAAGLSILPSTVTRAADPTAPKRFIAFFTGNGTIAPSWATAGGTESSFTLGTILQPLTPFRDKLILIDGLDNDASYEGPGAGHQKGCGAFLTAMPLLDGNFTGGNGEQSSGWASGPSIDQVIAKELGGDTPLRSLELGVQVEGSNNRHRIAYAGSNQPLPPDDDPESVFSRLFAGLTGGDTAAIERLRRRRQSVLDYVKGDLGKLKQKLGSTENERLEAHLSAVSDVENKLEMLQGKTCTPPTIDGSLDPKANANYEKIGQLQMDLLAASFACDITRYATVLWGGGTSGKAFPWLGFSERHHELSHAGDSDTVAKGKLVKINNWYAKQFAYLLAKLDAIPEGTGTVLDNTVVLWGSELSVGNTHSRKAVHWVLAGSGGGAFKTGRYLKYAGEPHNNLLVSIANAMGHSISTFGSDACTGALGKLTG